MEDETLIGILVSLTEKCSSALDRMRKEIQLSSSECRGLMCLAPGDRVSCQTLSARMDLSFSRSSRVIERLWQKGFIKRVDSSSDRRCKNVWLTEKGVRARQKLLSRREICEKRLSADMSEKRLEKIKSDLKGFAAKFSSMEPSA